MVKEECIQLPTGDCPTLPPSTDLVPLARHAEMAKFARNFGAIGEALAQAEALCHNRASVAADIAALLEKANATLHKATRVGPLLRFEPTTNLFPEMAAMGMTKAHVKAIDSWLPAGGAKGKWTLMYRATTDGWGANNFHAKCDNKRRLLTIIRSTSGHLFGGFSTEPFNSNVGFVTDSTAFLYTLTNPHGVPPTKIPCTSPGNAIYGHPSYNATYGTNNDLYIVNNANQSSCTTNLGNNTYRDPTGRGSTLFTGQSNNWTVAEMLAFQV